MTFKEGLQGVNEYWNSVGYDKDPSRKSAVNGLASFLEDNNLSYSHDVAFKWLESNKWHWKGSTFIHYRRAIQELDSILSGEQIPPKYRFKKTALSLLPQYWQRIIKGYNDSINNTVNKVTIHCRISACIKFASYLVNEGVLGVSDLTISIICGYPKYANNEWNEYQGEHTLQYFLRYLSTKEGLPQYMVYAVSSPLQAKAALYMSENYKPNLQMRRSEEFGFLEFWNRIDSFINYLTAEFHYDASAINFNYTDYFKMYSVFCCENHLLSNPESENIWFAVMNGFWDNHRRRSCAKRAFALFHKFNETGLISRSDTYHHQCKRKEPADNLLPDFNKATNEFLEYRRNANLRESSIKGNKSAAVSFFLYLQGRNITHISEITPFNVKDYFIWFASHFSKGKCCYASNIKAMLAFFYESGFTKTNLSPSVATHSAQIRRIVDVLNDDEITKIYACRDKATSPLELRDAAVLMLGLLMGFRKVDIINLKYSDIDWKNKTVSITQQKTYRPLVLPMPVPVGNSIYSYIRNGRFENSEDYIFQSLKPPYRKANVSICDYAVKHVLPDHHFSFHILRRTFASKLLLSGANTETIKDALGHSDTESINRYLSIDDAGIKSCCLPLERIRLTV